MAATMTTLAGVEGSVSGKGADIPVFQRGGGRRFTMLLFTLACDANYLTGGYDIASTGALATNGPYDVFTRKVELVEAAGAVVAPGGAGGGTIGHYMIPVWDRVNKKVLIFDNNVEVANATSLALFTGNLAFWMKGWGF